MPQSPVFESKLKKKYGRSARELAMVKQKLIVPSKDMSTVTKHIMPKREVGAITPAGLPKNSATLIEDADRYKPKRFVKGVPLQLDGTILERQPANVAPPPGSVPFYERSNSVVQPQQSVVVLTITPTASKLLYLRSIGHTFFDGQEEFFIITDGTVWKRWNYQIGTPVNLYQFQGTLSATKLIEFGVRNLSPEARNYEMVGDGWEVIITMLHSGENIN